jgi:hypothetical protein
MTVTLAQDLEDVLWRSWDCLDGSVHWKLLRVARRLAGRGYHGFRDLLPSTHPSRWQSNTRLLVEQVELVDSLGRRRGIIPS